MANCITPVTIEVRNKVTMTAEKIPVPCGKCQPCKMRRVSNWSFRLMQEGKRTTKSFFLTLTYKNPIMSKNGFMTLDKNAVPNFMKRLRNTYRYRAINTNTGRTKYYYDKVPIIKYYAVGEYGSKELKADGTPRMRPHHHLIIFGADQQNILDAWKLGGSSLGYIHFGQVSGASIGYTLKYISKDSQIPKHRNDDRIKEMGTMSKGIGKSYLTPAIKKWHTEDLFLRLYIPLIDGKKAPMPKYYRDRIYTERQRTQLNSWFKYKSPLMQAEKEEQYFKEYGPDWPKFVAEQHLHSFKKMQKNANTSGSF